MTQKDRVLEYLRTHEEITPMEAFYDLGITKLATVVSELIREDNAPIEKIRKSSKNRYGEPVSFMSYRLKETQNGVEVDKTVC